MDKEYLRKDIDRGYQDLANAIIADVAEDYEKIIFMLTRVTPIDKRYPVLMDKRKELVDWFHSDYYQVLSNVDGDYIMKKIEEKVRRNARRPIPKLEIEGANKQ